MGNGWKVLLGLGILLVGCAPSRLELVRGGAVQLKVAGSRGASRISEATAFRQDERFVVAGRVRRWAYSSLSLHVDAAVHTREGSLVAQARSGGLSRPWARGWVLVPFQVNLPAQPPEGGTVLLTLHESKHET